MINLQQTKIDTQCSIRVWSKIDDAFKILVKLLQIKMTNLRSFPVLEKDIFYIPYDENGKNLGKNTKKLMRINFSIGQKIKIIHPDSSSFGMVGVIKYKSDDHYSVKIKASKDEKESLYALGNWMIDMALRGATEQFSYINENLEFVNISDIKQKEYVYGNYKNDKKEINLTIEEKFEEIDKIEDKEIENNEIENNENKEIDKPILLTIGNTHQIVENDNNNSHKWKVFVKSNEDVIENVTFYLHSSFNQNEITIKKSPFEVERIGWGTFSVKINVLFKNGKSEIFLHNLCFDTDLTEKSIKYQNK